MLVCLWATQGFIFRGERNSDVCLNKGGKDLWWYTLGVCWGVLAIVRLGSILYQLQAHSQTFRKGGDKCVQAITKAT